LILKHIAQEATRKKNGMLKEFLIEKKLIRHKKAIIGIIK
jgi:hypothetical protein